MGVNELFQRCSDVSYNRIVVVEEKGKKFLINNPDGQIIIKVKVDGCVVTDSSERCDYIFEIGKPVQLAFFVELKGAKIKKACSQLYTTLSRFNDRYSSVKKEAYIVASNTKISRPEIAKEKKRFKENLDTKLTLQSRKYEVHLPHQ